MVKMDLFRQKILSTISVNASETNQILSSFNLIKINKGENLIEKSTVCNHYYFLEKGLLRFIYHSKDIEETSWIIVEGTFFTEIMSIKSKEPTNMSLEALEPSIVLSIDELNLNELCNKVKSFERYLRLTWEGNLRHVIEMKLLQQFSSAKERYEMLRKNKDL